MSCDSPNASKLSSADETFFCDARPGILRLVSFTSWSSHPVNFYFYPKVSGGICHYAMASQNAFSLTNNFYMYFSFDRFHIFSGVVYKKLFVYIFVNIFVNIFVYKKLLWWRRFYREQKQDLRKCIIDEDNRVKLSQVLLQIDTSCQHTFRDQEVYAEFSTLFVFGSNQQDTSVPGP